MFFCKFSETFKNMFFHRTPTVATSVFFKKIISRALKKTDIVAVHKKNEKVVKNFRSVLLLLFVSQMESSARNEYTITKERSLRTISKTFRAIKNWK